MSNSKNSHLFLNNFTPKYVTLYFRNFTTKHNPTTAGHYYLEGKMHEREKKKHYKVHGTCFLMALDPISKIAHIHILHSDK